MWSGAALNILREIGFQILIIDEIHNILAGSWREQRIVLNTLRFLSNELKVSLVCFGILEARDAINRRRSIGAPLGRGHFAAMEMYADSVGLP